MPSEKPQPKSNSNRQREYVARLKEQGYVNLSSVYVPKAISEECRVLVRNHVAEWESKQTQQF